MYNELWANPDFYSFDSMLADLAQKPILWISGKRDNEAPEHLHTFPIMEKLKAFPENKIVWRSLDTDHYFTNIRIQSSYEIARFLSEMNVYKGIDKYDRDTFLVELRKLLNEEFKTITLRDAAEHFCISPPYLSKLIKEKTGSNFTKILTDLKMDKATELLTTTKLNVDEIAECLGYNDSTYFMKSFKKHFGLTPTEFRLQQST